MKTRRFFSVFLLCALIVSLFATPLSAAAETDAKTPPDPGIESKAALLVDANTGNVVYAKNGVCCTSVPLGAQVGLDVLKNGGNAVDAAVAMAGAMPLLEPTGNGLGSDCFALVWIEKEKKLYGLNSSGVAPMALSADEVRAKGFSEVPEEGWLPTMVPGAPAGWAALNARFGTKPLS